MDTPSETLPCEEAQEKGKSILNEEKNRNSILKLNPRPKLVARVSLIMDGPMENKYESGKLRLKKNSPFVIEACKRLGYNDQDLKKK
jgi:hypothetical protein